MYTRKFFEEYPEVKEARERTRIMREGEFRKWLIKNKPKGAVMTPIETTTATGVPDIFSCYQGNSIWMECKITMASPPRIRGTQYAYIKKLVEAGGSVKIVVQSLSPRTYKAISVDIYDASVVVSTPLGLFKHIGQELVFPTTLEPWFKWKCGKDDVDDLYLKLLIDINKFTC